MILIVLGVMFPTLIFERSTSEPNVILFPDSDDTFTLPSEFANLTPPIVNVELGSVILILPDATMSFIFSVLAIILLSPILCVYKFSYTIF